jgi:hypothetical protein
MAAAVSTLQCAMRWSGSSCLLDEVLHMMINYSKLCIDTSVPYKQCCSAIVTVANGVSLLLLQCILMMCAGLELSKAEIVGSSYSYVN